MTDMMPQFFHHMACHQKLLTYPSEYDVASTTEGLEYALLVTHVQWTANSTINIMGRMMTMEPMLVELATFFDAVLLVERVVLVVGSALTTVGCSPS